MEEIWKDIKEYEGLYQVSNLGRVRGLKFGKERILVGGSGAGYLKVLLSKGGKSKNYFIHRLVAQAFLPNPDNLPIINHKDECKTNNVVTNLEWCNYKYNNTYGTGAKHRTKTKSKPVYQYTLDGTLVRSYPSTMEAQRRTGFFATNISKCCTGKNPTAYGYIWSYNLLVPRGRLF